MPLLVGSELVVEGNHHATAVENGVGGNKPLGLVGHDDRRSITGPKTSILQGLRQEKRTLVEVTIGEAFFLALAVGFDQACFSRELVQRVLQRRPDGLIFGEIQHYRRD